MNLEVKEFNNQKEFNEWMQDFNKQTAAVFNQAYNYYLTLCENDTQKEIFSDWWHGQCISTKEYENKYSEKDLYNVHSIVLDACSNGFG